MCKEFEVKSPTYKKFCEDFSVEEANAIMVAALSHGNGINDTKYGSDKFRWALTIVLGYRCVEKEVCREHHGITVPWDEFKKWVKAHGDLVNHDGDVDYLAMAAGVYNEYMPKEDDHENTIQIHTL